MNLHSSQFVDVKQKQGNVPVLPEFALNVVMSRVVKENPDWSQDRLSISEYHYRQFMALCKSFPDENITVPSSDIDEVWHSHILHTEKYADDCNEYFGFFLHHSPFNEENPCPSEPDESPELFRALFGLVPVNLWGKPKCKSCNSCTRCSKCRGKNCRINCKQNKRN
jgi:hypothetical protein